MPVPDSTTYIGPPISTESTATCPRCGTVAVSVRKDGPSRVDTTTAVFVVWCNRCRAGTVVVEEGTWSSIPAVPTTFEHSSVVLRWPPADAAQSIDPTAGVPAKVIDAYAEGLRCLSVDAPNAAVGRFRSALALIANHQGGQPVVDERTLTGKLKRLYDAKATLGAFDEHASAIKALGDAGTHQEDWDAVTMDQASFAGQLTRYLIEVLYEVPARIARSRPVRPTS